jgi:small neutral amino acid transporter SnatA (MarC family)
MVASMLLGTHILALFGIGGGLLLAAAGWRMLHHTEDDDVHSAAAEEAAGLTDAEIVRRSFFPMTFPLTTGPGTIAASIAPRRSSCTWSAASGWPEVCSIFYSRTPLRCCAGSERSGRS